nr:uncharacterized protein LOC129415385 [Misgurnus anguillicaudatus]
MKAHEGDLGREISKVHGMVCELRAGFSRALLELNQIQQGDTELQSQLEDTRHGCNKRALHLESLVLSLKDELEEVRCQFRQLCGAQERRPPENPERESNGVENNSGQCDAAALAPPSSSVDGSLLINCYLQGLQVWQMTRHSTGPDSFSCHVTQSSLRRGKRRSVVEILLRSEREYVSSLNQLYDKYKSAPASTTEKHEEFVKHVDQMLQRHLLFRNTLEERLTTDERSCAAGEAFLNLTGQHNKSFSDAYIGYVSGLATILTAEFTPTVQNKNSQENFKLLSLLFAPVSRIHTYLNIIQALLHSSGAGHADWCSLQESERVLLNLCTSCRMTLEKAELCEEGAGPEQVLRSRCCAESPDCGPSAFTKYRANASADTANDTAGPSTDSTLHKRKFCLVGLSRTLPRPSGILRNAREYMCEPPSSGWTAQHMWDGSTQQSHTGPVCVPFPPFPHHPLETGRFLNPEQSAGEEGKLTTAVRSPNASAGLAVRVCGSPGLDGRVYTSDPPPHRHDDGDTDCDLADASVFDFSSVTTCSPDDTLRRLRGAEACDDEEGDDEDSEIPVLLKPSYTHNSGAVQAGGSLCMPWQIPRRVPIPSEVRTGLQGKTRNPKIHRTPISSHPSTIDFRPIWGPTYSQGDVMPAKENSVTFSATNQIISQQQETDQARTSYRGAGVQRAEAVWRESEDSEGPCSTV